MASLVVGYDDGTRRNEATNADVIDASRVASSASAKSSISTEDVVVPDHTCASDSLIMAEIGPCGEWGGSWSTLHRSGFQSVWLLGRGVGSGL